MSSERAKCTLHAKRPSQKMDMRWRNVRQSFGGDVGIALRLARTACFCWRWTQQAQSSANFALPNLALFEPAVTNPAVKNPELANPELER